MELPKSSAFGLVHTLVESGFLEQNDRHFSLGLNAFRIGQSYASQLDIIKVARPFLKKLAEDTQETCFLAKETGGKIIYLDKHIGSAEITSICTVGKVNDMYLTGLGKAILACYGKEKLDAYLHSAELKSKTKNTITTYEGLIKDTEITRTRGFAVDDREDSENLHCLASCIRKSDSAVIGAISIATPWFKMTEERFALQGELIKTAALEISQRMGFSGSRLYFEI